MAPKSLQVSIERYYRAGFNPHAPRGHGKRHSARVQSVVAKSDPQTQPELVDARIAELDDWRGEMLSRIRKLTKQALPDVVEEIKWRKPSNPSGVPVWSHDGMLFTGEPFKEKVKLTFAKGASLEDPAGLFNGNLGAKVSRAIDLGEGDEIDEKAFKDLVRAAAELNA
jgi:hypothetical protein